MDLLKTNWTKFNNYNMPEKYDLFQTLIKCKTENAEEHIIFEGGDYDGPHPSDANYYQIITRISEGTKDFNGGEAFNGIAIDNMLDLSEVRCLKVSLYGKLLGSWSGEELKNMKILKKRLRSLKTGKSRDVFILDLFEHPIPLKNESCDSLVIECTPNYLLDNLYLVETCVYTISCRWHVRQLNEDHFDEVMSLNQGGCELPCDFSYAVKVLQKLEKLDVLSSSLNELIASVYLHDASINGEELVFECPCKKCRIDWIFKQRHCHSCSTRLEKNSVPFYNLMNKYESDYCRGVVLCANCSVYLSKFGLSCWTRIDLESLNIDNPQFCFHHVSLPEDKSGAWYSHIFQLIKRKSKYNKSFIRKQIVPFDDLEMYSARCNLCKSYVDKPKWFKYDNICIGENCCLPLHPWVKTIRIKLKIKNKNL